LHTKGHKESKWFRDTGYFGAIDLTESKLVEPAEAIVKDSTLPANICELAQSVLDFSMKRESSRLISIMSRR
jgi:hypothetical protein